METKRLLPENVAWVVINALVEGDFKFMCEPKKGEKVLVTVHDNDMEALEILNADLALFHEPSES